MDDRAEPGPAAKLEVSIFRGAEEGEEAAQDIERILLGHHAHAAERDELIGAGLGLEGREEGCRCRWSELSDHDGAMLRGHGFHREQDQLFRAVGKCL